MGKATGFLEFDRENTKTVDPKSRIKKYKEFHFPPCEKEQRNQGNRSMD